MDTKLRKVIELAVIRALPEFTLKNTKKGRLKNLYQRLQKITDIELSKVKHVTGKEIGIIGNKLDAWGLATGWINKEKHVATLLSFLLAMIENSEFTYNTKISDTLVDIFDYMDRIGNAPAACLWSGDKAAGMWLEMING